MQNGQYSAVQLTMEGIDRDRATFTVLMQPCVTVPAQHRQRALDTEPGTASVALSSATYDRTNRLEGMHLIWETGDMPL